MYDLIDIRILSKCIYQKEYYIYKSYRCYSYGKWFVFVLYRFVEKMIKIMKNSMHLLKNRLLLKKEEAGKFLKNWLWKMLLVTFLILIKRIKWEVLMVSARKFINIFDNYNKLLVMSSNSSNERPSKHPAKQKHKSRQSFSPTYFWFYSVKLATLTVEF